MSERTFWRNVVIVCALPSVARLFVPSLAVIETYLKLQQLAFGVMISVAVGAGIYSRNTLSGTLPRDIYLARQKRIAMIMGMLIGLALVEAAIHGRFGESGGWVLAPVCLLGPAMYLRDAIKH
jgi:hypothetical protein